MNKIVTVFCLLLACVVAKAQTADVTVYPSMPVGRIKLMNAVNNGPQKKGETQHFENFESFKAARFPYVRTHDSSYHWSYGGEHTVDITAIFPDFSRDVNDPQAYNFVETDHYLETILEAGSKVFFRLGQRIEHTVKIYNIYPPSDYEKWARICEHIIRHYNEGWADGFNWGIEYWEIWNEPDDSNWQTKPQTWGGSESDFFEFFTTSARYLKKQFPGLKIGGPAVADNEDWSDRFLAHLRKNKVDIDFFSWHNYAVEATDIGRKANRMHKIMEKHGYGDIESILNEWNYVQNWTDQYPRTIEVISNMKGAAFTAAVLTVCQDSCVDMLMYYDARPHTVFNGMFDFYTLKPRHAYYALYGWGELLDYGTQVKVENDNSDIYVTAAVNPEGALALFITRYNRDDNVCAAKTVRIRCADGGFTKAFGHLTDESHLYTKVPVTMADGALEVTLEPESFIMIECMPGK